MKDKDGWDLVEMLFCGSIMLLLVGGWIVIGGAAIWFFGSGLWETATTGTMPTDLLQFFKGIIGAMGVPIGAIVGLAFIWKEDPKRLKGLKKVCAISATIILIMGVFTIINWTHTGRGAVEYSDD